MNTGGKAFLPFPQFPQISPAFATNSPPDLRQRFFVQLSQSLCTPHFPTHFTTLFTTSLGGPSGPVPRTGGNFYQPELSLLAPRTFSIIFDLGPSQWMTRLRF